MNEDQAKGRLKDIKGEIKEQAGKATGDAGLRDRGTADKVAGKVQGTWGDVKEGVRDALRDDGADRKR